MRYGGGRLKQWSNCSSYPGSITGGDTNAYGIPECLGMESLDVETFITSRTSMTVRSRENVRGKGHG